MEFIGRLAALVPRPRANLARFHGVFSRGGLPYNSKLREHVVPQKPIEEQEDSKPKAYSRRGPIEKFKVSINEDVALESRGARLYLLSSQWDYCGLESASRLYEQARGKLGGSPV